MISRKMTAFVAPAVVLLFVGLLSGFAYLQPWLLPKVVRALPDIDPRPAVLATGIVVPVPNLDDPVDYVAWVDAQRWRDKTHLTNGAPVFDAAYAAYVEWPDDDGDRVDLPDRARAGDPSALADSALRDWVESNREALRLFREAAGHDHATWPLTSSDGTLAGVLLEHLSQMRALAKLVAVEGRMLLHEGRYAEAVERYASVERVGAMIGAGSWLIEAMVGLATQDLACAGVMDIPVENPASADFAKLAERVATWTARPRPISQCIQFERAMLLDAVQNMAGKSWKVPRIAFPGLVRQADALYDETVYVHSRPPDAQSFDALAHVVKSGRLHPIIAIFVPSFRHVGKAYRRGEAHHRGAVLVLRLFAYRNETGAFPDSLDNFTGEPWIIDPFTDEQLVYQRESDDFRLYSVGADRSDDGGDDKRDVCLWPRPTLDD